MSESPLARFIALLDSAITAGRLSKLTLSRPQGGDPTLKNLFVRPVLLKAGRQFAFVWRHETKDITKNFEGPEALSQLHALIGTGFLSANLFTTELSAQLSCETDGKAKLKVMEQASPALHEGHDREKAHVIPMTAPWLQTLGITNAQGKPRAEMTGKFRQIEKFAELITHLVTEAPLPKDRPWTVVDMGCGKGYLTFATAQVLGKRAKVTGIELRPNLVDSCNALAVRHGFAPGLEFKAGSIADSAPGEVDVLIALHACDTATDDALAAGIAAKAPLIIVAPCCQKELRGQLKAPAVLSPALRHGIFQERQSEFVTDALRALLLERAGYRTKVFEFISTEHTAKNLMVVGILTRPEGTPEVTEKIQAFARFYGITQQTLAEALGVDLAVPLTHGLDPA